MSDKALQHRRRRTAMARNKALSQVRQRKKASSTINASNTKMVNTGVLTIKEAGRKSEKARAVYLLSACGIDVTLSGLSPDYRSSRFSFCKEETGTEILRNLDTNQSRQYKDLKKERKFLDVKKIALNDAIRVLDDKLSDTRIMKERIVNFDYGTEFNKLAKNLSMLNLSKGGESLKYYRDYSENIDPRDCQTVFADRHSYVFNFKTTHEGIN